MLVGVLMVTALLEGVLREEASPGGRSRRSWRSGLAPVLLWRRTRPLACVVVGFGTAMALGLATLVAGAPNVGLDTMVYLVVLVCAAPGLLG